MNIGYHQIQSIPTPALFLGNPAIEPPMKSNSFPLTDGTPLSQSVAHGLGGTPNYAMLVLHCTTADTGSGFAVGRELDLTAANGYNNNTNAPSFGVNFDGTNVYVSYDGGAATAMQFCIGGNIINVSSLSNFSLKVYYNKFS